MAHILIFELPGGNDSDILEAAIARGDRFSFLSAQRSHYRQQPAVEAWLAHAATDIEITPFDYHTAEQAVLRLHARDPIDALLCLVDIRLPEAARLASRLGTRHLNPASAQLLRDKFLVRARLASRALPQPEFRLASSNKELKTAVTQLGLPVVIKPVDGYGSQNIVLLRYEEDLDPLLSPLDDLLPCHADYGLGVRANSKMLVERQMTGTVIGCDTMTAGGQHHLLGIHYKQFFAPPSFAIRGGCFTPNRGQFAEIEAYLRTVLDNVEFDWGAAHIELMLTDQGPRLIEINPRLVGAKIPRLVGYALNRSLHAALIALHTGETLAFPANETDRVAVTRWISCATAGILDQVDLPVWRDSRIRCVEIIMQAGDAVRPPFENADRIGYVMVCAATRAEAEELAERYIAACHCRLRPAAD